MSLKFLGDKGQPPNREVSAGWVGTASSKAASQAGLNWPFSPAAAGAWQDTVGQLVLLLQGSYQVWEEGRIGHIEALSDDAVRPSNLQFVPKFFVVK